MAIEDEGQLNMRRQTNILLFSSSVEMRLVEAEVNICSPLRRCGATWGPRDWGARYCFPSEGKMLYIPFWMLYMLEILCMPFPLFLFYMFQLFLVARYVQ